MLLLFHVQPEHCKIVFSTGTKSAAKVWDVKVVQAATGVETSVITSSDHVWSCSGTLQVDTTTVHLYIGKGTLEVASDLIYSKMSFFANVVSDTAVDLFHVVKCNCKQTTTVPSVPVENGALYAQWDESREEKVASRWTQMSQ